MLVDIEHTILVVGTKEVGHQFHHLTEQEVFDAAEAAKKPFSNLIRTTLEKL